MLSTNFQKIKVCGGVSVFKTARIHSFTGASKTFFKKCSNQTKVVNENTEGVRKALYKM